MVNKVDSDLIMLFIKL